MIKRLFDFTLALLGIVALSPLLMIIAFLIRWKLGSPIFFTQERPGLNGKPFKMVKFRTMLDAYDSSGNHLPNVMRFTGFGNLLRTTSLDELPGLWNVLKGEMSLVGPRPLLMEYLPLYSEEQARRHHVKPGITGWAQVNGRNAISWEQKFEYDVWYVANQDFWLDVKILFLTAKKVFMREDINAGEGVTMQKFSGTSLKDRDNE
ncbi:MAG TPA: sugar transferase [Thiopseudomonas sp.]|nr:sugar transferase [Thiopseudomonas sp.]